MAMKRSHHKVCLEACGTLSNQASKACDASVAGSGQRKCKNIKNTVLGKTRNEEYPKGTPGACYSKIVCIFTEALA